jgi:hypothetical protein
VLAKVMRDFMHVSGARTSHVTNTFTSIKPNRNMISVSEYLVSAYRLVVDLLSGRAFCRSCGDYIDHLTLDAIWQQELIRVQQLLGSAKGIDTISLI